MNKILFVNGCVREGSRTQKLAEYVIKRLEGEVLEVNLEKENIKPLEAKALAEREHLIETGKFSDSMFVYAKEFADADIIVVAAPYWDLSFPAMLKIYFEAVTVSGIAFRYLNGIPQGLCKAKKLIYVTTAGGPIYYNMGFDYVKALAQNLYGIDDVLLFKAENLDIEGNDVESIIRDVEKTINTSL